MIPRLATDAVRDALRRQAAVALTGPRQVGKTTLARAIAVPPQALYLDLEKAVDRQRLSDAAGFLSQHEDELVVLDEIHKMPELFQTLRGVIDEGRMHGHRYGRFLILGSAALDLLRQSGESLAGRIAYVELTPVNVLEIENTPEARRSLWLRGGFPDSYLPPDDADSLAWRQDFIRTYLEREVPMFGPRIPAETLRLLWTMIAHGHATPLNASILARNLSISYQSVQRYIDLLVDLLLVRRLRPYFINLGKRLTKAPKIYVRDTGIQHALLDIADHDTLAGHGAVGSSWEGFVIENLLSVAPRSVQPYYYRTARGAEIDLLLEFPGGKLWAIEIKSHSTKLERGFHTAREDLKPERSFVVHSGPDRYPLGDGIEALSLHDMATILHELNATRST
jgi:predicted AAA+ superfamily ATPase